MAANNGRNDGDKSFEIADETIRRFLLGGLRASEQPAFDERLLSDHALAERVHRAELELADDYAYQRLNKVECELFEAIFLLSADRERKLRVSRSLRDRFAPASASRARGSVTTAYFERLRSILSLGQPAWRFAFAALIFILLVGAAWLVVKDGRIKNEIKRGIEVVRGFRRASVRREEVHHPPNVSTPEHQPAPPSMPGHERATPTAAASAIVLLKPASSPDTGNMPSVDLPKGDRDVVRLQLALKPNQVGSSRVEVLTSDGQSVFSAQSPSAAQNGSAQVDFDVPAQLLKPGNYQIRLIRGIAGAKENTDSYYFRAQ